MDKTPDLSELDGEGLCTVDNSENDDECLCRVDNSENENDDELVGAFSGTSQEW